MYDKRCFNLVLDCEFNEKRLKKILDISFNDMSWKTQYDQIKGKAYGYYLCDASFLEKKKYEDMVGQYIIQDLMSENHLVDGFDIVDFFYKYFGSFLEDKRSHDDDDCLKHLNDMIKKYFANDISRISLIEGDNFDINFVDYFYQHWLKLNRKKYYDIMMKYGFDSTYVSHYLKSIGSCCDYSHAYDICQDYCFFNASFEEKQECTKMVAHRKQLLQRDFKLGEKIYKKINDEHLSIKDVGEQCHLPSSYVLEFYYKYSWSCISKKNIPIENISEAQELVLAKYLFYSFINHSGDMSVLLFNEDFFDEKMKGKMLITYLSYIIDAYINKNHFKVGLSSYEKLALEKMGYRFKNIKDFDLKNVNVSHDNTNLFRLNNQDQRKFLKGLSIEEFQKAGDWFYDLREKIRGTSVFSDKIYEAIRYYRNYRIVFNNREKEINDLNMKYDENNGGVYENREVQSIISKFKMMINCIKKDYDKIPDAVRIFLENEDFMLLDYYSLTSLPIEKFYHIIKDVCNKKNSVVSRDEITIFDKWLNNKTGLEIRKSGGFIYDAYAASVSFDFIDNSKLVFYGKEATSMDKYAAYQFLQDNAIPCYLPVFYNATKRIVVSDSLESRYQAFSSLFPVINDENEVIAGLIKSRK